MSGLRCAPARSTSLTNDPTGYPTDHFNRKDPPHNPSVVGSIPTGLTDFPDPGPVQSNLSDEFLVRCEILRDLAKCECAFTRHSYREPRMLASFRRGVLASRDSVSKHPWR